MILEIARVNLKNGSNCRNDLTLLFKWSDLQGKSIFEGIGYQMNPRQIIVSYFVVSK